MMLTLICVDSSCQPPSTLRGHPGEYFVPLWPAVRLPEPICGQYVRPGHEDRSVDTVLRTICPLLTKTVSQPANLLSRQLTCRPRQAQLPSTPSELPVHFPRMFCHMDAAVTPSQTALPAPTNKEMMLKRKCLQTNRQTGGQRIRHSGLVRISCPPQPYCGQIIRHTGDPG